MLAFEEAVPVGFDAAFVHSSPLAWVARNASKPKRPDTECWTLHSTHEWAKEHIDKAPEEVAARLTDIFRRELGLEREHPGLLHRCAHRWRYAEAVPPLEEGVLFDAERSLAVAGDWVGRSRIEGAFLSGSAAAGRILGTVGAERCRPHE